MWRRTPPGLLHQILQAIGSSVSGKIGGLCEKIRFTCWDSKHVDCGRFRPLGKSAVSNILNVQLFDSLLYKYLYVFVVTWFRFDVFITLGMRWKETLFLQCQRLIAGQHSSSIGTLWQLWMRATLRPLSWALLSRGVSVCRLHPS